MHIKTIINEKDEAIKLQIYAHPSCLAQAKQYAVTMADEILSDIHEDDNLSPSMFYVVDQRYPQVSAFNI